MSCDFMYGRLFLTRLFFGAGIMLCAVFAGCAVYMGEETAKDTSNAAYLSLRQSILKKADGTVWTDALEADRLKRDSAHHVGVADYIELTPEVMAVSRVDSEPVFPNIEGFGSLDTSAITAQVRRVLDNLVTLIKDGTDIKPLMADGMEYQAAFFMDDMSAMFGGQSTSAISAIYGKPFFGDDGNIMLKIRLNLGGEAADIRVTLMSDGGNDDEYKIVFLALL